MKKEIERLKKKYEKKLLLLPHVVGVGIGFRKRKNIVGKKLCLKVYVEKKIPQSQLTKEQLIPRTLEGIETDVEEVGKLKAL